MKTELLAPAKNINVAIEAINCGADAVYIGANSFGARKNASNTLEDIKKLIEYAHKFWVRVYVTLNTILSDDELSEAYKLVVELEKLGVDALIIQDMGLLKKCMDNKITLPIHISTQCDNYLSEKVKFFNDMGIKRVVLARESSIGHIKKIHDENPELELENFIHGALCVSFSGQCYLSQYIGGRSANRGECAQPCRRKYNIETKSGKVIKKDVYALCLKDFNAAEKIDELVNAGVSSFKIEGRLKDENYVKNVVSFYRNILKDKISSGKSFINFLPNPHKSFNRDFTEYFLIKRTDCFNFNSPKSQGEYLGKVIDVRQNCFKIDSNTNINSQDGLCFNDFGFLVNKVQNSYIYPNKKINIKTGDKIYRNYNVEFEKELAKPVKRQIGLSIKIENNIIYLKDEDGVEFAFELQHKDVSQNQQKMRENFVKQMSKTGESDFYITDIEILSDIPFIPISEINSIRRNLFENLMKKRIDYYNKCIRQKQNQLKYVPYYLKKTDYKANVYNEEAKSFYQNCGCEIAEYAIEKKMPDRQIELMRCKHCIKYALNMCKTNQELQLRDNYNNVYPLVFDCKNCEMKVLSFV